MVVMDVEVTDVRVVDVIVVLVVVGMRVTSHGAEGQAQTSLRSGRRRVPQWWSV